MRPTVGLRSGFHFIKKFDRTFHPVVVDAGLMGSTVDGAATSTLFLPKQVFGVVSDGSAWLDISQFCGPYFSPARETARLFRARAKSGLSCNALPHAAAASVY